MRVLAAALGLLLFVGCASETEVLVGSTAPTGVDVSSCAPTPEAPLAGLVAVTSEAHVHVWNRPGAAGFVDLGMLGSSLTDQPTEGEGAFVESAAVVPATCGVFVGLCCEPVSGLTKWFKSPDVAPVDIFGRLPAVSPDGARVALVGYGILEVRSVEDPTSEGTTIKVPGDGSAPVLDLMWLDGDRLVLLVSSGTSVPELHVATVSEGTMSQPFGFLGIESDVEGVLLSGVDGGTLEVQVRSSSGIRVIALDTTTLEVTGEGKSLPGFVRRNGDRTVLVSPNGNLSAYTEGDVDPTPVGDGYLWAG